LNSQLPASVRFRIYPNPEQIQWLHQHIGATRFVYNHGLEWFQEISKEYQKCKAQDWPLPEVPSCYAFKNWWIRQKRPQLIKEGNSWLKDLNQHCLCFAFDRLAFAIQRFLEGQSRFPRFKKRFGRGQSAKFDSGLKAKAGLVQVGRKKSKL
jgi:transposase